MTSTNVNSTVFFLYIYFEQQNALRNILFSEVLRVPFNSVMSTLFKTHLPADLVDVFKLLVIKGVIFFPNFFVDVVPSLSINVGL